MVAKRQPDRKLISEMARDTKRDLLAGMTEREIEERDLPPLPPKACCADCRRELRGGSKRRLCFDCQEARRREWEKIIQRLNEEREARRAPTCAATCYEVEPGVWLHHPWNGCETPVADYRVLVPVVADCGCVGTICRRCWLCKDHCRCVRSKP